MPGRAEDHPTEWLLSQAPRRPLETLNQTPRRLCLVGLQPRLPEARREKPLVTLVGALWTGTSDVLEPQLGVSCGEIRH